MGNKADIKSFVKDKQKFEQQLLRNQLLNPSEEIIKEEMRKVENNLKILLSEERKIKQQLICSSADENKLISKLQSIQKDIKDLQSQLTMVKDLNELVLDQN